MSHASCLIALPDQPTNIEVAIEEQMDPFREEGAWFEDGTRWDWYVIGGRYSGHLHPHNQMLVSSIHPNKFADKRIKDAQKTWGEMVKHPQDVWPMIFARQPDATLGDLILEARQAWFPYHYAFLQNKHWHERERLGFFGRSHQTECERKGASEIHRCKSKSKNSPEAYIVTWQDDWKIWDLKFYDRFIKPLAPTTLLVTVDYHI